MPGIECCPLSIIHKDPGRVGEHLHQSGRHRTPVEAFGGVVERGSECTFVLCFRFSNQRAGGATPFREVKRDPRFIPALAFP